MQTKQKIQEQLKCDYCEKDTPDKIMDIIFSRQKTYCLCPNCLSVMIQTRQLELENRMDLQDSITGKPGAVEYHCSPTEKYILEKDAMMRLLSRNLYPSEYFALKTDSTFQYMLHDDFYSESGRALQPVLKSGMKEVTSIRDTAYSLYKTDWINQHIEPQRMLRVCRNFELWKMETGETDRTFTEWLDEFGFEGEIYACMEEFLDTEYKDREYMLWLLKEKELIELYLNS